MIRRKILIVSVFILATAAGSIFLAAGQTPVTSIPTQQTGSVDIEVLNVARPNGIFLSIQPANFSAAFSFSPSQLTKVNKAILTINWDQNSLGHVGDQFSIELNGHAPVLMTLDRFATHIATLSSTDVVQGANTINIGVIPISPFATQSNTNYLLFEVRLTVQYTFLSQ